jgi:predicted Rdx family selenoprotein
MASVIAPLPRMTIQFCTQCKWMLRAAYVGLESLTFSLYSCCDLSQVLVALVLILPAALHAQLLLST